MNAMCRNALNAYSQVGVETGVSSASPHQLIVMLYEGAIAAVIKARFAMEKKQTADKCEAISKAIAIIQEGLQLSLDMKAGGEIAQNLNGLYDYMCNQLLLANLKNKTEPLDEVGRLLVGLKGAWASIGQKQIEPKKSEGSPDYPPPPPPRSNATSYGKV